MKEIHAVFSPGQTFVTVETEWQYDSGYNLFIDGLELPSYYEVDFCNEGDLQTVTIPGNAAAGVRIPDAYFLSGKRIKAYTVFVDSDGIETKCQVTINVRGRPERSDIDPPSVEQQQIDALIDNLNTAVDNAEASAEESERQAGLSEGHALDSEAWATGKRGGVDVDEEDETYHNNAAWYAGKADEISRGNATLAESWAVGGTGTRPGEDTNNAAYYARLAEKGAEEAGYAWFDINDENGNMYVTVTANLDSDVSFEIDESTGTLEVIINE